MFASLDESIGRVTLPVFTPIAKAFRHNLGAVISTVSVPFQLIVANAQRLRFQQIHISEAIRAQIGIERQPTEVLYEKALPVAREQLIQELETSEAIKRVSST